MAVWAQVNLSLASKENRWGAEFFQPRYLKPLPSHLAWTAIGRILAFCQYGLSRAMNDEGLGHPMYRMNEMNGVFLATPERYAETTPQEYDSLRLIRDDVLFNRTNSYDFVGRTGILKHDVDAVFASYLIRIRPKPSAILPEFLTLYLSTPFGIDHVKRRAMRSINQANVSASELKRVPIPLVPIGAQKRLAKIVNAAASRLQDSDRLCREAETLLGNALRLDKLDLSHKLGYESSLSEITSTRRWDARFYDPRLAGYYRHFSTIADLMPLTQLARVLKFENPPYADAGIPIVTQKHLGQVAPDPTLEDAPQTTEAWVKRRAEALLRPNELLLYSVGAYLGKTNIWCEPDLRAVPASFITLLRARPKVDAGYLMAVLNSEFGIFQSKTYESGTSQPYIYPSGVRHFRIPLLKDDRMMTTIGAIIRESYVAIKESKALLENAKHRVEELIEKEAAV